MTTLHCPRCDQTKPLSEFPIDKRRTCGHSAPCKSCTRERSKAWYAKNKEKKDAQSRAWAMANPEKMKGYLTKSKDKHPDAGRQRVRKSYQKHREKRLAEDKTRREANKEIYLLRERASYAKHKEARAERFKRWADKNKSKIAAYAAERRAARRQSTPPWLTDAHYAAIFDWYKSAEIMEQITGYKWHVDHIVPLRGKTVSGLHVPWNMQVLPATENLKKHNIYWPDMP